MAVQTIGFDDKQFLNQNSDIADVNKVNDTDINEIKSVVNNNATILQGETTYSLSETDTGKTWVDGKPIYRKVIDFGALPNTSDKFVPLDITNLDRIIFLYGLARDTLTGNYFPLPNGTTVGSPYLIDFAIASGGEYTNAIRIRTQTDRTNFNAYIILEYTKTTD